MAVAGLSTVVVLGLAANAVTPSLTDLSFALGLTGLPLLSGVAQVVMLSGGAMVWSAVAARRRG